MYKVYGELGEELYTGESYRDAYESAKEYIEWYDDLDGQVQSAGSASENGEIVSGSTTMVEATIVLV